MTDAPVQPVPATAPAEPMAPADVAPSVMAEPQAVSDHWLDSVAEGDTRTWAETKGLRNGSIENVLGSYHNLEKLVGADKAGRTVTLLGPDATSEQINDFYNRLGRPETAEGYNLAPPEGEDGAFADWAGKTFHAAGLSDKQAAYMAEQWTGYVQGVTQAQADQAQISSVDARAELKLEWGAAFDSKSAGVDQAAIKLGFTPENLSGLRSAMGPVAAMKFIDSLNSKLGEHTYETGVSTSVATPEQAGMQMNQLLGDKDFVSAWQDRMHPDHNNAVERKAALSRLISGIPA